MRKIFLIVFILLMYQSGFAQKVSVNVIKTKNAAQSGWQILTDQYLPVFSGDDYYKEDSVVFSLESDKRYLFAVSVADVSDPDTSLYTLLINNEPVILVNSDIVPGDHFFAFYTGTKERVAKITGGTSADISEFPWQVYLEAGDFTCGGSIISDQWIITAAHCTRDEYDRAIPASKMDVIAGATNPLDITQGKTYYVSEVVVHEKFNSETLENDIALLKLKQPVSFTNAEPIKLVSARDSAAGMTDPGVMSWVTGYGLSRVVPPTYPSSLQKVQLPIVSNEQAATVWGDISKTDLMAGYLNGNKDACNGDSGGPLVVPYSNGYKLAGLVSWGSSKCNTYGAYTRISCFGSWITLKTGIEISYSPPLPSGDTMICYGVQSGKYSVAAIPDASAYEWQLLPADAGTIIPDAENATVSWASDFSGSASVKFRVTRNGDVSDWSELKVSVAKYTRILRQSADTTLCVAQPVSLNVETEGHNLTYSWYKDGAIYQRGSSSTVKLTNALTEDSGRYICEVTGSCGSEVSEEINMTVLPLTKINSITSDKKVAFGDDITLEVDAEGHNLTYQWTKDDDNLPDGTLSSLALHNVNAGDIGLYYATVTGSCGVKISDKTYLYVKKEDSSSNNEVFLWPTLVDNQFTVALSYDDNYNIIVFNTLGKLIKEITGCSYQTTVDISGMPAGMYIVIVCNKNIREPIKIIKR